MYDALARFYDQYTEDMDRSGAEAYLLRIFRTYGNNGLRRTAEGRASGAESAGVNGADPEESSLVIDVGCGTGTVTVKMAELGFDMTGLDLSPEMLEIARENGEKAGKSILWLCQDMCRIDTFGSYAAMYLLEDCVNHVTSEKKLSAFFRRAANFIDDGGLLIFDFLTPRYFEKVAEQGIFFEDSEQGTCLWTARYSPKTGKIRYEILCYGAAGDGLYTRDEDAVTERAWTPEELCPMLGQAGFELLELAGDYSGKKAGSRCGRIYLTARKIAR